MVLVLCISSDCALYLFKFHENIFDGLTVTERSVLPRLRFCAIVPQNFEYDTAKTVPVGHLAHIDFGLSQDFESVGCVENSHAKNNIVFHRNSRSCNGYFDWCIGFLNCTGTSIQ